MHILHHAAVWILPAKQRYIAWTPTVSYYNLYQCSYYWNSSTNSTYSNKPWTGIYILHTPTHTCLLYSHLSQDLSLPSSLKAAATECPHSQSGPCSPMESDPHSQSVCVTLWPMLTMLPTYIMDTHSQSEKHSQVTHIYNEVIHIHNKVSHIHKLTHAHNVTHI